jgi:hypothetical protein
MRDRGLLRPVLPIPATAPARLTGLAGSRRETPSGVPVLGGLIVQDRTRKMVILAELGPSRVKTLWRSHPRVDAQITAASLVKWRKTDRTI